MSVILLGGSVFAVAVSHLAYRSVLDASRVAGLEFAATTDPVTELCNRRWITDLLEQACVRVKAKQQSLSILMLDLDHFKRVNDTFGHPAGDSVLKRVGKLNC